MNQAVRDIVHRTAKRSFCSEDRCTHGIRLVNERATVFTGTDKKESAPPYRLSEAHVVALHPRPINRRRTQNDANMLALTVSGNGHEIFGRRLALGVYSYWIQVAR